MHFDRVLYVAHRSDHLACTAIGALSKSTKAETRIIDDDDTLSADVPVIPIFTHTPNGVRHRFPNKAIRAIQIGKPDPCHCEIPVPSFVEALAVSSSIAVAIKSGQDQKIPAALQNFHLQHTGENLNPREKTHRKRYRRESRPYFCGGFYDV